MTGRIGSGTRGCEPPGPSGARLSPDTRPTADQPTSLAGGRYRVEEKLGHGATATVWQVTDTVLGVRRAVKLLSAKASASRPLRRRLLAEARTMAQLEHPNILRIYDIGQEGDRDYVVMALAENGSLADWVDAHGPMPPDMALSHLVQALSALHVAHLHGIVHRDIKPQNLLIGEDGRSLLADFGIALLAEDQLRATRTGVAMGSLAFMAPEQRLDARSVTAAADLYAVGTTLYNLLTTANPVDLFTAEPTSPRWDGVPADVAAAIRRAVSYAPADRFTDARAMAHHLRALLDTADRLPLTPPPQAPRLAGWEDTERPHSVVPDVDLRPSPASVAAAMTFLSEDLATTGNALSLPEMPPPSSAVRGPTQPPVEPETTPSLPPGVELAVLEAPTDIPGGASPLAPVEPAPQPRSRLPLVAAAVLLLAVGAGLGLRALDGVGSETDDAPPVEALATGAAQPGPADLPASTAPPEAAEEVDALAMVEPETQGPTGAAEAETASPAPPASSARSSQAGSQAEPDPPPRAAEPASAAPAAEEGAGTAAPPEDPPVGATGPAGTWEGNVHASQARLVLRGAAGSLQGTLTTLNPLTGGSVSVPVTATWDEPLAQLRLEEQVDDVASSGVYTLQLDPSGQRLTGTYSARVGSRSFRVELKRTGA